MLFVLSRWWLVSFVCWLIDCYCLCMGGYLL